MKCSKFEERIYLYDELTARERQETDDHLKGCIHCARLMDRMDIPRKAVSAHRTAIPMLADHAAMTRRIMDSVAVMAHKNRPTLQERLRTLIIAPIRYQMAMISTVLIVFFFVEYAGGSQPMGVAKRHRVVTGPRTELNLASFHGAFFEMRNDKRTSISVADCIQACVHTSASDCKDCAGKFEKP